MEGQKTAGGLGASALSFGVPRLSATPASRNTWQSQRSLLGFMLLFSWPSASQAKPLARSMCGQFKHREDVGKRLVHVVAGRLVAGRGNERDGLRAFGEGDAAVGKSEIPTAETIVGVQIRRIAGREVIHDEDFAHSGLAGFLNQSQVVHARVDHPRIEHVAGAAIAAPVRAHERRRAIAVRSQRRRAAETGVEQDASISEVLRRVKIAEVLILPANGETLADVLRDSDVDRPGINVASIPKAVDDVDWVAGVRGTSPNGGPVVAVTDRKS